MATDPADAPLYAALEDQRRLGVLGTSVAEAVAHSELFLPAVGGSTTVLDLGSGAGVPGLVLAWRRPDLVVILLDARQRRTDQLQRLVGRLGLSRRVSVRCGTAEELGRWPGLAGGVDAVVARSFGPPAEVIAAARPFLRIGGRLVVSDPPDGGLRWTRALLAGSDLVRLSADAPGLFVAELRTSDSRGSTPA